MNSAHTIQNELHENCLKQVEGIKEKCCRLESILPKVTKDQIIMWEH